MAYKSLVFEVGDAERFDTADDRQVMTGMDRTLACNSMRLLRRAAVWSVVDFASNFLS